MTFVVDQNYPGVGSVVGALVFGFGAAIGWTLGMILLHVIGVHAA